MRDLILQLSREQNMAIFLNSHDLDEVERICAKIAIIQNGTIRAYDSVSNLRSNSKQTVMRFTLSNDTDVQKATSFLNSQSYVENIAADGHNLTVTMNDSNSAPGLLVTLVKQGINVEEAQRVTRSLEDVYLEIMKESKN